MDLDYPIKLRILDKDFPFLPERKKVGKVEKLVCDVDDKKKICYSQKCFKTSIKSWVSTKKSTQSNSI